MPSWLSPPPPHLWPLSMTSTPRPASSHRISSGFHQPEMGSSPRETGNRRIHSPWRNPNVLSWHESPAALEPLPISISTLPEPTSESIPDPDIEITSDEEETFEPTVDNHMDVARMTNPIEYKARLPEDFSGKNNDTTWWLLAMKAYFGINNKIYKDDKTVILVFLIKWVKEGEVLSQKDGTWN